MENTSSVTCPNCGFEFDTKSAIAKEMRVQLEKEFFQKQLARDEEFKKQKADLDKEREKVENWKLQEKEILQRKLDEKLAEQEKHAKLKAAEEFEAKMKLLAEENEAKAQKLKSYQQKEIDFLQKVKSLNEKEESMQLEMEKQIAERSEQIRREVEKLAGQKTELILKQKENELRQREEEIQIMIERKSLEAAERVRIEEQMKQAELIKQLEDQKKLAEEMRKKSEQGSMQLQGEIQELELENLLRNSFPGDSVEEVGKGVRGADCILTVMSGAVECGKIIFESKRTKAFSAEWINKLKEDQRAVKADIAVIVTEALPKDMLHFGMIENVWVCTYAEAKSVVAILRSSLIQVTQAVASQENKGDKMHMLYDYLTGNEFRQSIEAIVEAFQAMQADLEKERRLFISHWEKRNKQIDKVMQNTLAMFGSVKGIAGGAVQEIKGLQMGNDLFHE